MNTISLINMKGGVGKTTLSVNIADCLNRRHGAKVLLVDIDPQFNATQCLMTPDQYVTHLKGNGDTILQVFDRNSRPVASMVEGSEIRTPKKLAEIAPIEIREGFHLLPGNLELYRLEMSPGDGRENRLSKFIEAYTKPNNVDYVIIDTPPTPSIWMTSALLASDYYIIPVKPDPISFTGIDLLGSIIEDKRENFDLKLQCAGVVLTMIEEGTLVHRQAATFLSGTKWAQYKYQWELPKRTAIAREQLSQTFILEMNDESAKAAITGIVDELLEKILE